jgi:rod shape determining protein RodA
MWNYKYLRQIDFKTIPIIFGLMFISLLVISSMTTKNEGPVFFTPVVKNQIEWFLLGWIAYLFFAGFNYKKLRDWSTVLYTGCLVLLVGLFFVNPIQNVHRWYKIPLLGREFQPSEYAKVIIIIALSSFLASQEKKRNRWEIALKAISIVFIPFLLILKQPDLGTAFILYPITLVMFYFGNIHNKITAFMSVLGIIAFSLIGLFFTETVSHEKLHPYATKVLKEYQYERLNPDTYHKKASQIAIGLGGWNGQGWNKGNFAKNSWLPAAHTDSVFAAFAEEFGVLGVIILLLLFFGLIYFNFQVTSTIRDLFGQLLSAGVTTYLAIHVILNIGMMCGFLPITGIPLILITYGGSSVVSTMAALGIIQSVYSRRYIF